MIRKFAFWLIKIYVPTNRRWVLLDLETEMAMNWEVEKMQLNITNKAIEDKPYNRVSIETKINMSMELKGLNVLM